MAFVGDTVRLKCVFKTFDGLLIDPSDISLTIYDKAKNVLETIPIGIDNKESVGKYFYDYTPLELNEFIFEFKGSFNNKPILCRGQFGVKFI